MTDEHETNNDADARFAEELEAEAQLRAEADAAVSDVPPLDAEPAPASGAPASDDSWAPLCRSVTSVLQATVFPQWSIDTAQREEFAVSLGECLDQIAPGGLAGKYACWARLIVVSGGIFVGNVIANDYKIPPLGPAKADAQKEHQQPEGELAPVTDQSAAGEGAFKTAS